MGHLNNSLAYFQFHLLLFIIQIDTKECFNALNNHITQQILTNSNA